MYARGLSVGLIAELQGTRLSTVKGYIQHRRAENPGLAAQHAAAAPRTPSDLWRRRLSEMRNFIATHGRYPGIHGGLEGEAQLYGWLSEQRHALVGQTLGWEKMRELGVLGDWVTTDRERARDARWRQRLGEVAAFVSEHGRLPRHRTAKNETDRVLGIWLQTQGIEAHHRRLAEWRLEALNEALPGWMRVRGGE